MKTKSLRPSQGGKFHPPVVPTMQQKTSAYQCPGVDWSDSGTSQVVVGMQKAGDVVTFDELEIGRKFVWEHAPNDSAYRKKISVDQYDYQSRGNGRICSERILTTKVIIL